MRKGPKLLTVPAIVLTIFVFLMSGLLTGCGNSENNNNANDDKAIPVGTTIAASGVLSDASVVSGHLEALSSANVVPKMGGRVAEINVDIGSNVRTGQLLVRLGAEELSAAVNQGKASLAAAQAKLEVSEANYIRGKALLEQGAISQAEYEGQFSLVYKADQQQVEMARAQLEMAQANYNNALITSPIDGVVTARNVNLGEMAAPSMPVVTVVNLNTVVVRASISEDMVNKLKENQEVKVKVAAASDKPFTGKINNIALAADPATKAFPIKIQIANTDHVLKPGMFAEVTLGAGTEALLLPSEAIMVEGDEKFVFVVEEGLAKKVEVTTGASDGKSVALLSGVKEGAEIVTVGQHYLEDGMKVSADGVNSN